jgi:archaellum component FlaG (FlaF/FlaG flagellin family)
VIRHKSLSVASRSLSVIVDVGQVVDAKALTLTSAKRHVVLDPTVVVARGAGRAASRRDATTRVEVDDGVRRLRIASLPSRSTIRVKVDAHVPDLDE